MSLDLGPQSPLENNTSLLAIIESLENLNSGSSPLEPLPISPGWMTARAQAPDAFPEDSQAEPEEQPEGTVSGPNLIPMEEVQRYPSPLLAEPLLDGIPSEVYTKRPYNLYLPRGHIIRPNLILKPPRENRLPPFQTLIPAAKDSFFPLTIQHQQGEEKFRLNTYGILKPIKLNTAIANANAAMGNRNGVRQNYATILPNPHPRVPVERPESNSMERYRRFVSQFPANYPPPILPQPEFTTNPRQPPNTLQNPKMRMYNYAPPRPPAYSIYNQEQYTRNLPMTAQSGGYHRIQMGTNPYRPALPFYNGMGQDYPTPMGFSGGSLDTYKSNRRVSNSNYPYVGSSMAPPQPYVRPPPYSPYPQQQAHLMPFHPNQQGGPGLYSTGYPPTPLPGEYFPPAQSYAQPEKYRQEAVFRPGPYSNAGQAVRKTKPPAAIPEGTSSYAYNRVPPATYYSNNNPPAGYTNKWPTQGRGVSAYHAYSWQPGVRDAGRASAQSGSTFIPSQQNDSTPGSGTRVNPYFHFRRNMEQIRAGLEPDSTNFKNNTIPRTGTSGNFTQPVPRSQQEVI